MRPRPIVDAGQLAGLGIAASESEGVGAAFDHGSDELSLDRGVVGGYVVGPTPDPAAPGSEQQVRGGQRLALTRAAADSDEADRLGREQRAPGHLRGPNEELRAWLACGLRTSRGRP